MQKEQGLIESPEEIIPIFEKFIRKGNSKAVILTPKYVDIKLYLEELETNGFKVRQYTSEIKDPKTFDDSIDVWYGDIEKVEEFMLLFGDKLTIFLINRDFDKWISDVKEIGDDNYSNVSKAQFAIMYDELYSITRKGQAFRDAVGTMTTLIIHLSIKEKYKRQSEPKIDQVNMKTNQGNDQSEEVEEKAKVQEDGK